MDTFTATSCIKFGWETFKKRPWFLIGATALVLIILWGMSSLSRGMMGTSAYPLIELATIALSVLVDMGMVAFFLKAHDDVASLKLNDLWHPRPYWSYLAAVFLIGISTIIGFLLLVIPGIFLMLMWIFVKLLIIDRDLGPISAMKESARLTKGSRLELLLLVVFAIAINIVGAIFLLVGLFVTVPVSVIAAAHAYRTLSRKAGETVAAA